MGLKARDVASECQHQLGLLNQTNQPVIPTNVSSTWPHMKVRKLASGTFKLGKISYEYKIHILDSNFP
jgi:hypothetical protein